jgi:hypothetical protein
MTHNNPIYKGYKATNAPSNQLVARSSRAGGARYSGD